MTSDAPYRVVLVDDHTLFRAGLKSMLEAEGILVVGQAATAQAGLDQCLSLAHDVILLDLNLPDFDGVWLLSALRERGVSSPALVVSVQTHEQQVMAAFRAGARGYLTKTAEPEIFRAAFYEVARGGSYVEPKLAGRLLCRPDVMESSSKPDLSERMREILLLASKGLSNQEIAASLHLSEATVKTHLNKAFRKLNVVSRAQAVNVAVRMGVIPAPTDA